MSETNQAIVRRYFEEVLNGRKLEVFDELADPAFASYLSDGKSIPISVYKQAIAGTLAAMPDLHVVIEDQFSQGDKVVTRWRATGTPRVAFAGIPPDGKPIAVTAIHIHHLRAGKLLAHWEAINLHAVQHG